MTKETRAYYCVYCAGRGYQNHRGRGAVGGWKRVFCSSCNGTGRQSTVNRRKIGR